jgi:hypothetical protein
MKDDMMEIPPLLKLLQDSVDDGSIFPIRASTDKWIPGPDPILLAKL